MPIHDFHCAQCNQTFELHVRHSDTPQCPQCGSTELEKLMSAPAPAGRSAAIIRAGRQQAAKEGHFSNYASAERKKGGI